jgi:UDP-N-acetylmuramyl pentapeptide phosphotransferase/UDP-N-acetylglucosamine-1-phosphate transferase
MLMLILSAGAAAGFSSWLIIGIYRRWALGKQVLDYPNERSLHVHPTPRGGGIGIILSVMLLGNLFYLVTEGTRNVFSIPSAFRFLILFAGLSMIIVISWLDDIRSGLPILLRLSVHTVAAVLTVLSGKLWSVVAVPFMGDLHLGRVGFFVSVLWIVALVNIYNFMDGIDGIAGIQALTASLGWLIIGLMEGNSFLVALCAIFFFSSLGFLVHNWFPSKIFLGDVGSAFLGFCFSVLPLAGSSYLPPDKLTRIPLVGFLVLAPFILDATFTLIRRALRREPIAQAHRSHLYQRLVITGLGHSAVAKIYLILGLLSSSAAVFFYSHARGMTSDAAVFVALVVVLLVPFVWATVRERKRRPEGFAGRFGGPGNVSGGNNEGIGQPEKNELKGGA